MNNKSYNQKTKITATVMATCLGMAGMLNHGLFEIMQGNVTTPGFYIEAIGEKHRFWVHGTEGAFTLIPNFLITGILAVVVGIIIIVWGVKYIQTQHGASVFLGLMVLLTLVGGGLGHIVLFLPTWAYATRINKPLSWWKKMLQNRAGKIVAQFWTPLLVLTVISWLMVMQLGIFGYFPFQNDPDLVLNITFGFVFLTLILTNFTFISAISKDIQITLKSH